MRFFTSTLLELKCGSFCIITTGMWFRLRRWNNAGYWVTWSTEKRVGECIFEECPVWQIGKGIKFRIACFRLE